MLLHRCPAPTISSTQSPRTGRRNASPGHARRAPLTAAAPPRRKLSAGRRVHAFTPRLVIPSAARCRVAAGEIRGAPAEHPEVSSPSEIAPHRDLLLESRASRPTSGYWARMAKADATLVRFSIDWFRSQGFTAEKIPERRERSPDIRVSRGDERYLIELKSKEDDPEKVRRRVASLRAGEIVDVSEKLTRWNTIDGIIDHASEQLASREPEDVGAFGLILFLCDGREPELQAERIFATAYGSTRIASLGDEPTRRGFYVRDSAFFRNRSELDGLILANGQGAHLLLNNYSPRYKDLSEAALVDSFRQVNSVTDPLAEEADGRAYIADCSISRQDEAAVVRFLQKKYGKRKLIAIDIGRLGAMVQVPGAEPEE